MTRPGSPSDLRLFRLRSLGMWLLLAAAVTGTAIIVIPIPDFEELEFREGVLVDARRERFRPCRSGDCTRTIVTVDHEGARAFYHFGDIATAALEVRAPITVGVYPEFLWSDRVRVWHAEQGGRILRDYSDAVAVDRRIRLGLLVLMPLLAASGIYLRRRPG